MELVLLGHALNDFTERYSFFLEEPRDCFPMNFPISGGYRCGLGPTCGTHDE
jgi:hypothetical protein